VVEISKPTLPSALSMKRILGNYAIVIIAESTRLVWKVLAVVTAARVCRDARDVVDDVWQQMQLYWHRPRMKELEAPI
jgi:hypothetical protein